MTLWGAKNLVNSEMKDPENNFDRAIEFLENRKIESLSNLTSEIEKKDLSNEFDKGIQILKEKKKKLTNVQETEKKKSEEIEKRKGRKK